MSDNTNFIESPVNKNNESKRLPVVFCLDISPSMHSKGRITQLNLALNGFIEELQNDIRTKIAAEIAIVTFSSEALVLQDFQEAGKMSSQQISAVQSGVTFLGKGILLALELISKRKEKYTKAKVSYFLPYLIIITDGNPEFEDEEVLNCAITSVYNAAKARGVAEVVLTFPIGVGSEVEVSYLNQLANGFLDTPIIYDDATEFAELFQVISQSIHRSVQNSQNSDTQKNDIRNTWLDKLKKRNTLRRE